MDKRTRIILTATAATLLSAIAVTFTALTGRSQDHARPSRGDARLGIGLQVLSNGVLSIVPPNGGPAQVTSQRCDRAYAASGTVACLRPVGALRDTRLVILDRSLHERRGIGLTGFPNRLRVSPSGRLVGWTLFLDGHAYAGSGFSTQAGILDVRSGSVVKSLEEFKVTKDGRAYRAADINFWGITFTADDDHFYATMSTGGHRHLVEGSLSARSVRTLADNVECPSLSPDGTRVAYKSAVGGDPRRGWNVAVLDLATMRRTTLAENRSVDDQPAWLDTGTVAYAVQLPDGTNEIYALPANGTGAPRLLISGANSPAPLPATTASSPEAPQGKVLVRP